MPKPPDESIIRAKTDGLLNRTRVFLDRVESNSMRGWGRSVLLVLQNVPRLLEDPHEDPRVVNAIVDVQSRHLDRLEDLVRAHGAGVEYSDNPYPR